ncbi:MAG: type II toxin-antitoxin system VapC family toxin [Blastocatellia bacterium]
MKLLLDTHAFIWWDSEPDKLSLKAMAACKDAANVLVVSVASIWEVQIKIQLGILTLRMPLVDVIQDQQQKNGVQILPVSLKHVLAIDQLPFHHKDPFDQMLMAQANAEGATIVSKDSELSKYPVRILW